jgi:predicted PurR-regulated permease PerM
MEAKPTAPGTSDGLRVLRVLVALASFSAFVLVIACLSWARAVLVPVALALLLTFLLAPIVQLLQRIGLHRTVAII